MLLPASTVGKKIFMAITGQVLILYVIGHVLGNSTIYFDKAINAYAAGLHAFPALLWAVRSVLIIVFGLHVYLGIVLKLENNAAKPQTYAAPHYLKATFAGRNMIWTGVLIFSFLVYHLLHFTLQITNPDVAALRNPDALGRPDVFMMVVRSFQDSGITLAYTVSLAALLLHLSHGIHSSFQTWGLSSDTMLPVMEKTGALASLALFFLYISIPAVIMLGILR
jgi:succinate dehydrogenase / fumarate reductase cytochrome b subunit